jgi:hypothetical protein
MPDLLTVTVTLLQAPKPDKQFKSATGNATAHSGPGRGVLRSLDSDGARAVLARHAR